jgi:hypothetical protein
MHYCVYVFVPNDGDIEQLVDRALAPYSEDLQVPVYKIRLDPGEIKAMATHYGLKPNQLNALAEHMKAWRSCDGGVDEKGLFALARWNPEGKWDWYKIGGRWRGRLRGNAVLASTLLASTKLKVLLPFAMLTPDGCWHDRETVITEGWMKWHVRSIKPSQWLRIVRIALQMNPDCRVVCVDIHR